MPYYLYTQVPVDGQYYVDKPWGVYPHVTIEAASLVIANGIAREIGIEPGTPRWPTVDLCRALPSELPRKHCIHYLSGKQEVV